MTNYLRQILISQFEAALAMMKQCVEACPDEHWEQKIASVTLRQVAYHTLFFVDLYLTPDENQFVLRDLHHHGGDERGDEASRGLSTKETVSYIEICRQKMLETLNSETPESLQGPSGFSYRRISRGELHIYNIRHVQHHTGQLSAYLRKVDARSADPKSLPWIGAGWR